MALEDLTGPNVFINALVPANPTADDDRSEGDNHIRGHKNASVNSFPLIAGPVNASHTELSRCAGATGDFQPQLDALDGRVTTNEANIGTNASGVAANSSSISGLDGRVSQNEADIAALQGGAGSLPAARGIGWNTQTNITSRAAYEVATGSSIVVPAQWGSGSVKIDTSVNSLLQSGGVGGQLLVADFAIFVNGVAALEFWAAHGIQDEVGAALLLDEKLIQLAAIVTAAGGQTIDIRAKINGLASAGMVFEINANSVQSTMIISRVDITA